MCGGVVESVCRSVVSCCTLHMTLESARFVLSCPRCRPAAGGEGRVPQRDAPRFWAHRAGAQVRCAAHVPMPALSAGGWDGLSHVSSSCRPCLYVEGKLPRLCTAHTHTITLCTAPSETSRLTTAACLLCCAFCAACRSGGGSLAAFHLGVVKALLEHHMLPRVLAGSSVGSVGERLAGAEAEAERRRQRHRQWQQELLGLGDGDGTPSGALRCSCSPARFVLTLQCKSCLTLPCPWILPPLFVHPAVCALVATRTDAELSQLLLGGSGEGAAAGRGDGGGGGLEGFDLSFFSCTSAPQQFLANMLAKVCGSG